MNPERAGVVEVNVRFEPSEATIAERDEEDGEDSPPDVSSPSGDLTDYGSSLTYDSDAGYLPRSVAQEYLRPGSDSDEGPAAGWTVRVPEQPAMSEPAGGSLWDDQPVTSTGTRPAPV